MTNYRSTDFLRGHIRRIFEFYEPNVIDVTGGFHQNYYDDGQLFDPGLRHLVSSTRMVFNYCKAYQLFGEQIYLDHAHHGIRFIRETHWDPNRQGYHWILRDGKPVDQTNHCYGLAFVMLAFAAAHEIGIENSRADLERVYELMERNLWQEEQGLYADEATPDWSEVDTYRGQNSNMHSCEAMLAAYQATGEQHFAQRARQLADKFTVELANKSGGLVWEHYLPNLDIDWDYNKDDPKNLYRPWGFQPGHQVEWAKLLLQLHQIKPEDCLLERAQTLFDTALEVCWDRKHGGIFYGFSPDFEICDKDKYFWVIAESLVTAAHLAHATGKQKYWDWYEKIWAYADSCMVDHKHGAWFRVLRSDNSKYANKKSEAGAKCDYHTIAACIDTLKYV